MYDYFTKHFIQLLKLSSRMPCLNQAQNSFFLNQIYHKLELQLQVIKFSVPSSFH